MYPQLYHYAALKMLLDFIVSPRVQVRHPKFVIGLYKW